MNAVFFLIPVATLLGLIFLGLFFWALKNGQFEDMEGPSQRILHNNEDDTDPK